MALPKFFTVDKSLSLLQTQWASQIDPVLLQPLNSGLILPNVSLVTGSNTINHRLGRDLQGWFVVRQRSAASIYDTQDSNQLPAKTLLLTASAGVVVDLFVF